jgi:REP element-mobilizing transposase RayT
MWAVKTPPTVGCPGWCLHQPATILNAPHKLDPFLKCLSCGKHKTMANTYHQMYIQTIFAVKYRAAVLDKIWRSSVQRVIGNLINETRCKTIIVNGVEDHMHCFIGLKPVVSVSELMKVVKAKSSKYINDNKLTKERFEWQEGYGVFSYRQRDVDMIFKYILNQEEHHRGKTFREEYVELLEEFNITYDEQYIFHELM